MEFCRNNFNRVVFLSFVEQERGREILQQMVDSGNMPDWVLETEYVTVIGGKPGAKDLRLLGVDPENALLIDDQNDYEEEEEEDDCYLDDGKINYRLLVKHLRKIAPHIDWRIENKGYDYDDGGGCCWSAIAVPNEQLHEAESIIERIERSDDIIQFSWPEDFTGSIYDERGNLRQEITEFVAVIKDLRSFVLSGYLKHRIESTR